MKPDSKTKSWCERRGVRVELAVCRGCSHHMLDMINSEEELTDLCSRGSGVLNNNSRWILHSASRGTGGVPKCCDRLEDHEMVSILRSALDA